MSTILIIDTKKNSRDYLKNLLALNGYAVRTAEDFPTAAALIQNDFPALIVTVGNSSNDDFFQFIDSIRKNELDNSTPIVLLADEYAEIEKMKRIDIKIDHFLLRPYRNIDILDLIFSLLRKGRRHSKEYYSE